MNKLMAKDRWDIVRKEKEMSPDEVHLALACNYECRGRSDT